MTGSTVTQTIDVSGVFAFSHHTVMATFTATHDTAMVKTCRDEGDGGMTIITGNAALNMI
jgi:hypothetical protein